MIALQPVEWRLRGAPGEFAHGDAFTVSAKVTRVTKDLALISCMLGTVYPSMRREIGEELAAMGFARVMWEDGTGEVYEQDLARYAGAKESERVTADR